MNTEEEPDNTPPSAAAEVDTTEPRRVPPPRPIQALIVLAVLATCLACVASVLCNP